MIVFTQSSWISYVAAGIRQYDKQRLVRAHSLRPSPQAFWELPSPLGILLGNKAVTLCDRSFPVALPRDPTTHEAHFLFDQHAKTFEIRLRLASGIVDAPAIRVLCSPPQP